MSFPSLEFNQKRWNRYLLHSYWVIFVLSIIIELLFLLITEMPKDEFVQRHIAKPTILFALIGILAEIGILRLPKHHDYVLISASAIFAIAIMRIHYSLDYLLFFLFFPVMISIFYFQIKKLLYAVMNTTIALIIQCIHDNQMQRNLTVVDIVTIACILFVFCCIAFGVLARGRDVLIHLRSSYESNQELLVRTILMDKLAKTDALTDAYNHMAYHEFMDNYVIQADNGNLRLQLAIIDIDNFKQINDTYGHKAGDVVLKKVAELIRSKMSSNDIVARYGGEEFALIFADRSFQEAFDTVELIRTAVESELHEAIGWKSVTISIGMNAYVPGMGKERLFVGADEALYKAKRSGKNRTVITQGGLSSAHA